MGRRNRRSGNLGDIHTFKGILNGGQLGTLLSSTSTHLGGLYIFKLSDFPIIGSAGSGLGASFDFCRVNKCKMEFLPRYNMQANPITTGGSNEPQPTFLTGLDEVPIITSGSFTPAPSWTTQGDEDADVTEATGYDHPRITPDYIRGMQNCKETETYKKHVVHFTPWFFNTLVGGETGAGFNPTGTYVRNIKKWINLQALNQSTGAEANVIGPDFYGPMYSFSNNVTNPINYYDVKIHYSVSFRRLKGI